jgi:hypothetical protein
MNPEKILLMLSELAVLKYFPAGNDAVLKALLRLVGAMCESESQVRWLVTRMTSGIYTEWPGPEEMRACFCCRYKHKDGINAYSSVYIDGNWPPDASARPRPAIAGPETKALPPGHVASVDPEAERMVKALVDVQTKTKARDFSAPVTEAERAAAPEWLRQLEGRA